MAIVTISGRAGMARSIKQCPLFIAWGQGESDEITTKVNENPTQTELFREIGRRVVDTALFVNGDDQGDLVTPSGRWTISQIPTNNLYISAEFDFLDGNGYTVREFGLFLNTVTNDDLPIGQKYFLPTEIEDPGELLMLENTVPIIRTGDTRYNCAFVLSL